MSVAPENRRIATPSIIDAIHSPALFQPWFRDPITWSAWLTFLRALFALEMDDADLATYSECTGRPTPPTAPAKEAWLVVGRRGGKSEILATIAVFLAAFIDWTPFLVPGESALVQVIATDRRQARVIYRYARAMLTNVPALKPLVASDSGDIIELTNGISIEITTCSFRAVRGYTVVAALLDEIAFWRNDETSANPDSEVLAALRPAMATIPNALLLAASSPYAKRGALYRAHREHYGKDGDPILVWQAPTKRMNPSLPLSVIEEAYERDPESASAEYGATFRSDIESFVSRETIDAVTMLGRHELPPLSDASYNAFVDPSGGSADSMTLAISHLENETAVLDAVRETRPPFSPEAVVTDFAALLKQYDVSTVTGDRYAGEWPRERFAVHGIAYIPSEKSKSDIYRELLPCLNGRKIELLDIPRLASQFCGLERRTARGGKDSIDHSPGAHDDLANSVAGALVNAAVAVNPWERWADKL